MTAPAAGWYPDPSGRPDCFRWWDGDGWTRNLTDDASASEPMPLETEPAADFDPTRPPDGAPALGRTTYPPGYVPPHRPARAIGGRSGIRRMVPGVVVVVALALVGLGIVIVQRQNEPNLAFPDTGRSATGGTPAPSGNADGVTLQEQTGELTLPGLELYMPEVPYETATLGDPLPGLIIEGAMSRAVVQEDYQGDKDWVAELRVGQIAETLVGKDVAETGEALFDQIIETSYGAGDPKLKKHRSETYTKDYPYPVRIMSADVHYAFDGVDSEYDAVLVLVSPRPDGGYNAWYSRRPANAEPEVKKALDDSIDTIRLS